MKGHDPYANSVANDRYNKAVQLRDLQQYHRKRIEEIDSELAEMELEAVSEKSEHVDGAAVVTVEPA